MRKKFLLLLVILLINNCIFVLHGENLQINYTYSINFVNNFKDKQEIQNLWCGKNVVNILTKRTNLPHHKFQLNEAYTSNWYYHNKKQVNFKTDENYGRFYIPDADINVSLIYIDYSNYRKAISAVNDEDSAAFLLYDTSPVIADHNYQGFTNIKKCIIGTKAFIKQQDQTLVYECIGIDKGINDTKYVYDSAGVSIYSYSSDILTLYTCDTDWQHVYLVKFRQIKRLDNLQKIKLFSLISEWEVIN